MFVFSCIFLFILIHIWPSCVPYFLLGYFYLFHFMLHLSPTLCILLLCIVIVSCLLTTSYSYLSIHLHCCLFVIVYLVEQLVNISRDSITFKNLSYVISISSCRVHVVHFQVFIVGMSNFTYTNILSVSCLKVC